MRHWFVLGLSLILIAFSVPASAQSGANAPRDAYFRRFPGAETTISPSRALAEHRAFAAALGALQPQRPGVRDVYVLSIGAWSDNVFQKEAKTSADILSRRFSAEGRTLVLTNGDGTSARPFASASPSGIAGALAHIGALMDKDEDILVLFMTSHGNPDGGFSVYEANRFEYKMSPSYLRLALEEIGVKQRLIIVSACFSGAFVAPLMNDTTIIFTAAAANKQSFGCQPERDWTYFGDAFINRGLGQGKALLPAFDDAKKMIVEWETRDKFDPSWPNSYVGPATQNIIAAMK
jgi:hypothetical protein